MMGGMGGGGGYGQAVGILGTLGTDIWGMVAGSDLFGSKPKVAPYKKVKSGEAIGESLTSNIGAMPQITQLGDLYKSYLTDQMNSLLPGYSDILKQGAADTKQELASAEPLLKGEIPQDIQDMVRRTDAYGSMMGGFAGSGMARNLTARDFGLTSLSLMQQGANLAAQGGSAAQRWAGLASGEVMNPSNFFVTPQQQIALDQWNAINRHNYLQSKYNVQAAPDPQTVGDYGILSSRFGALAGMGGGSSSQPSSSSFDFGSLFGSNSYGGSNFLDWGGGGPS